MATERIIRGSIQSEHFLTLFDAVSTRAVMVAEFVMQARADGEPVLVVATRPHWDAIVLAAAERGVDLNRAVREETVIQRDAEALLRLFSRAGLPDAALFDRHVGGLVRQLRGTGRLSAYGEMVDLLAARTEFDAALLLENLWNVLAERETLRLMCGYESAHFVPHGAAARLRAVCESHCRTQMHPDDSLGQWLLAEARVPFEAVPA